MPLAATTVTVAATPAYVPVLEPPATSYMLTTCALTSAWVGTAIPAEVRCAARTSRYLLKTLWQEVMGFLIAPLQQLKMLHSFVSPNFFMPGCGDVVAGKNAGYITSAEFGWSLGSPIALGWLPADTAQGDVVQVSCGGRVVDAEVMPDAVCDPTGSRIRT